MARMQTNIDFNTHQMLPTVRLLWPNHHNGHSSMTGYSEHNSLPTASMNAVMTLASATSRHKFRTVQSKFVYLPAKDICMDSAIQHNKTYFSDTTAVQPTWPYWKCMTNLQSYGQSPLLYRCLL